MTVRVLDPPSLVDGDCPGLEDASNLEFIDGRLVERNVSMESSWVSSDVMIVVGGFVRTNGLGAMTDADLGLRLFPDDPTRTRRADVAFTAKGRAPQSSGYMRVAPDLVVEVVSPGDLAGDVLAKADEWLRAGVRMVWVVYPQNEVVHVYRRGERPIVLGAEDEIEGYDVIPGFRSTVAEFFLTARVQRAEAAAAEPTPAPAP